MSLAPRKAALGAVAALAAGYAASASAVHVRRLTRRGPVVAFASGGAGTHVFPAIAIAEELRSRGVEAAFLGEPGGMEAAVARQYGFRLYGTSSVGLRRPYKSVSNVVNALRFLVCVAHGVRALVECAPDVVVGTGGKVSVPACVAAAALGIPLLLYEPNARAGAANRALHLVARSTLLAHGGAAADLRLRDRCRCVGPAVRREVLGSAAEGGALARDLCRRRRQVRSALGVPSRGRRGGGRPLLLVVLGGCQGSTYLNCATHNALPQLASVPGLHVLWQTGNRYHEAYARGYASTLPNVHCVPFIPDIGSALAAADLVLSRAGASTVAELRAARAPALLVPSPAVSEAVQAANARTLAKQGLAVVVPQADVDEVGIAPRLMAALAAAGLPGNHPSPPPPPPPQHPPTSPPPPQRLQHQSGGGANGPEGPTVQAPGASGGGGGGGVGGVGGGGSCGAGGNQTDAPALPAAMVSAMRAGERRGADTGCRRSLTHIADAILQHTAGR